MFINLNYAYNLYRNYPSLNKMEYECTFSKTNKICNFPEYYFKENKEIVYICSAHKDRINTRNVKIIKFEMVNVSDFRDDHMIKIQEKLRVIRLSQIAYVDYAKLMTNKLDQFCNDQLKNLHDIEKIIMSYLF